MNTKKDVIKTVFDIGSIIAYVAGLAILLLFCRIFIKPIGKLIKLLLNGIAGGFLLAAINFLGSFAGINVPINPLTSLIAGVLGLPGIIIVAILNYIL